MNGIHGEVLMWPLGTDSTKRPFLTLLLLHQEEEKEEEEEEEEEVEENTSREIGEEGGVFDAEVADIELDQKW